MGEALANYRQITPVIEQIFSAGNRDWKWFMFTLHYKRRYEAAASRWASQEDARGAARWLLQSGIGVPEMIVNAANKICVVWIPFEGKLRERILIPE